MYKKYPQWFREKIRPKSPLRSFWGIHSEMKMCIDLVAKGKLKAKELITHSFSLDEINKAFETAQDKESTGAVFVALTV